MVMAGKAGEPARPVGGRGDFGHQCVIGVFDPAVEDARKSCSYHGLVLDATICYGTLRGEHGDAFRVARHLGPDRGGRLELLHGWPDDESAVGSVAGEGPATWSGPGLQERLDDGVLTYAGTRDGVLPFELTTTSEQLAWSEGELVSLEGELVGGVGLQWYDATEPATAHASRIFRARGRIGETLVGGFLVLDQRYLPRGSLWSDTVHRARPAPPRAWTTFATEWEDGDLEAGHVAAGTGWWQLALVVSTDAPPTVTTDVALDRAPRAPFRPDSSVAFLVDGERWEWVPEPPPRGTGGAADPGARDTLSDGVLRRAGEERTPSAWMAWRHDIGGPFGCLVSP